MSVPQASLIHCEVLNRIWFIFLHGIKEVVTVSFANSETIDMYHLRKELNKSSMRKGNEEQRERN